MLKLLRIIGRTMLLLAGLYWVNACKAQTLSASVACMESKWTLTGSFMTTLDKKEKISLATVARYDAPYADGESRNMIIGNMGYAFSPSFVALLGTLYSPPSSFSPIIALQYIWSKENLSILLFPNLILGENPSLLSFIMAEYSKPLNTKLNWFIRAQPFVVNGFHDHYFSSIRMKTGLIKRKLQGGLAIDNDFFGNHWTHELHLGIFVQYQIF